MIIDRATKVISVIVCLLLIAFLISSCAEERSDDYEYIFSSIESGFNDDALDIEDFILVIPSDSSPDVYTAADELCTKISENTECGAKLYYSHEKIDVDKKDKLILIGDTGRDESDRFLRGFRIKDYGYKCDDGIIFLGGVCDSANLSAIEKFRKDVVVYADTEFFMNEDTSYFFKGEYDIENIKLNGFEICDYTIVYPHNDKSAYAVAEIFRQKLSERSGYYLSIESDKEVSAQTRGICIGDTDMSQNGIELADTEAKIIRHSTGISVISKNTYGIRLASEKLADMLCASEDASIEINDSIAFAFSSEKLDIMTFYLKDEILSMQYTTELCNAVNAEKPSIFRAYGISSDTADRIVTNIQASYNMQKVIDAEGIGIYHFYLKDKYDINVETKTVVTDVSVARINYRSKDEKIDFSFIEVYSSAENTAAASIAEAVNSMLVETPDIISLVETSFRGAMDTEFSLKLSEATRLSYHTDNADASKIFTYISGEAFFLNSVSVKDEQTKISLTMYK